MAQACVGDLQGESGAVFVGSRDHQLREGGGVPHGKIPAGRYPLQPPAQSGGQQEHARGLVVIVGGEGDLLQVPLQGN